MMDEFLPLAETLPSLVTNHLSWVIEMWMGKIAR